MENRAATPTDNGNPFRRPQNNFAMGGPPPSPYHEKAHGLSGESLDNIIRAAFTEGAQVGANEATDALAKQFESVKADIWDDGHRAGTEAAFLQARSAIWEKMQKPAILDILGDLRDLRDRAKKGSKQRERLDYVIQQFNALGDLVR